MLETGSELRPHLLYCQDGAQALFATWKLETGHEALAMFTTEETAQEYIVEAAGREWTLFQPDRATLVDVLESCQESGILYAALDPLGGRARTLFDIPRVLAASKGR